MDWTPLIGRPRPTGPDALRLLVVVHRLGEVADDPDGDDGVVRVLRGERHAQVLDHLVSRPATLAFVLMDLFSRGAAPFDQAADDDSWEQRAALARRVRWLLANDRRRYHPSRRRGGWQSQVAVDARRLHRYDPGTWHAWDAVLAQLATRDLLRVRLLDAQHTELEYALTGHALDVLEEKIYPGHRDAAFHLQLCTVIEEFLPPFSGSGLADQLGQVADRLRAFRDDHSLPVERDPAPDLFQATFHERL